MIGAKAPGENRQVPQRHDCEVSETNEPLEYREYIVIQGLAQ